MRLSARYGAGVLRVVPGSGDRLTAEFEVAFVDGDGVEVRASLADAAGVPFEAVAPVRRFSSYKRQRHFPGLWWSSSTGGHVGYESWLERDHLMMLDYESAVVGLASQPFWLFWEHEGRTRSHAPDYFARLAGGGGLVVDCRPVRRIKPRDAVAFEATRRACELVGWEYRLVGALDPVLAANLRWLAGYRHPRHELPEMAAALRAVFADPTPLMAGAAVVGDPVAVLPVLFHLLWRHDLVTDLSTPLGGDTTVATAGAV